jgi:hypothetical protein
MTGPRKANTYNPSEETADYPVGYGRPPAHTRFKPGQSGNPKGKPKGQKKLGTIFRDILNEQVSIREGDKIRKVSKVEAMFRAVALKAMKGDPKSFQTIVSFCQQSGEFEAEPERIEAIHRYLVTPDGKYYSMPSPEMQDTEKKTPFEFKPTNQDRSRK